MNPSGDMVRVHVNLLPANKGGGEEKVTCWRANSWSANTAGD